MSSNTISLESKYASARRSYERFQVQLAKKLGWNTFYQIRPIDLTREDVEKLSREDCKKLQRLYSSQSELYWQMHGIEAVQNNNMKYHIAAKKAYDFLEGFPRMEAGKWLQEYRLTTLTLIEKLMENPNFLAEVTA